MLKCSLRLLILARILLLIVDIYLISSLLLYVFIIWMNKETNLITLILSLRPSLHP